MPPQVSATRLFPGVSRKPVQSLSSLIGQTHVGARREWASRHAQPRGSWAPEGKGLWAASLPAFTLVPSGPLVPWACGCPSPAPGPHLRWPCAGSCLGGPARAACGICSRLVSPASGLRVGAGPSGSGTAGWEEASHHPTPSRVWLVGLSPAIPMSLSPDTVQGPCGQVWCSSSPPPRMPAAGLGARSPWSPPFCLAGTGGRGRRA